MNLNKDYITNKIYNWPSFEAPGVKKAPTPKFQDELELVEYLQTRVSEILTPPLTLARNVVADKDRLIPSTVTDIADDLIYGLECMARRGNTTAAIGLHEISETSILSVNRELGRGNRWLLDQIKKAVRWPAFALSSSSLKKQQENKFQNFEFGKEVPATIKKAGLSDPAHQLVNALFLYISDARRKIEAIEKEISFDTLPQSKISPVLLIIRKLPLQLTKANYLQYHSAGMQIMKETAGHENIWSHHPAFKQSPLKGLVPQFGDGKNIERDVKNAWKKRAGQD